MSHEANRSSRVQTREFENEPACAEVYGTAGFEIQEGDTIMKPQFLFLFFSILLFEHTANAQQTGYVYNRAGMLGGNRIMTVFGNWGVIGQPCDSVSRGAWLYPTNGYIGDMSIMVAVELPIKDYNNDGIPDTIHSVITCPVARPTTMLDVDPVTGKYWTFEPVGGFCDSSSATPAIGTLPQTWPTVWPDHPDWQTGVWNGLFGPDKLVGSQETFFQMDDRNDERMYRQYGFLPDTSDTLTKGQGIQVDVRYIQRDDPLFKDVMFRVFDIKNTSRHQYSKVVFGNLTGTYVGLTGCDDRPMEYDNDASVYFSSNDFVLTSNFPEEQMKNPLWVGSVGLFGEAFLESPGNNIASYDCFVPANNLPMGSDEQLWNLLTPGQFSQPHSVVNDTVATAGEDEDYLYGSNYFSLDTGETRRIGSVLSYGHSKDQVLQNILLAKALWNSKFDTAAMNKAITIVNFQSHRILSGGQTVQWTSLASGGSIDIWFSPDAGASWQTVAKNVLNSGSYPWNTTTFPDCSFGILRVFVKDTSGNIYGFAQSQDYFTIKNTTTGSPFVRIMNTDFRADVPITQSLLNLQMLIGEPQSHPLSVNMFYSVDKWNDYTLFDSFPASSDTNPLSHPVNLGLLPNSETFSLKVEVSDGISFYADSTAFFPKRTPRVDVAQSNIRKLSGYATVPVEIRIIDSSKVKPDDYIITFDDTTSWTQTTFSVFDRSSRKYALQNYPVNPGIESASFDGLAFYAADVFTQNDPARTRWNRLLSYMSSFEFVRTNVGSPPIRGYAQPHDYRIVYHDIPVDSSIAVDSLGVASVPVNFHVEDLVTGQKVRFVYAPFGNIYDILFIEKVGASEKYTWDIQYATSRADSVPHEGDTLFLYTKKGLSFYDSLEVSGITVSVKDRRGLPSAYRLDLNYPNPFNPTTTIGYQLPIQSHVTLKVFDVLGREVVTLVNGMEEPGSKSVTFDASRLSSGVYFYRLQAGNPSASSGQVPSAGSGHGFTDIKKMLLLK